jgi:hypothetical protein
VVPARISRLLWIPFWIPNRWANQERSVTMIWAASTRWLEVLVGCTLALLVRSAMPPWRGGGRVLEMGLGG